MSEYTAEQIDACILAYKAGDLNYCRAGIVDLLTAFAATLRQQAERGDGEVSDEILCDLCRIRPETHSDAEGIGFCDECWAEASTHSGDSIPANGGDLTGGLGLSRFQAQFDDGDDE